MNKAGVLLYFNLDKGMGHAIEYRYVGRVFKDRRLRYSRNNKNKAFFPIDKGDVAEAMKAAVFKVLERSELLQ